MLFEVLDMQHKKLEYSSQLVPIIQKGCRAWLLRNAQENAKSEERERNAQKAAEK